jgi:hypothetical protein
MMVSVDEKLAAIVHTQARHTTRLRAGKHVSEAKPRQESVSSAWHEGLTTATTMGIFSYCPSPLRVG